MTAWSRAVAGDPRFQHAVLSLIVLNAVVMGLETSSALASVYAPAFWWFHALVQAAFVAEMSIRLAAHGARPAAFFRDGWNTFDFAWWRPRSCLPWARSRPLPGCPASCESPASCRRSRSCG